MAGTTWRRQAAVAAAAFAAICALAACGSKDAPGTTPTATTGAGQLGGAPSATASATGVSTTTPPSGGGGGGTAPTYPKKAGDYAVAFMTAVSAKDTNRLNALAEQAAVLQATGGHPTLSTGWTVYSCSSPDANNQIGCTVRNNVGDDARVTMKGSQLGFPTAVIGVLLDLTEYPSAPGDYVGAMLTAKDNDNKQRVVRLANSTVLGKLTCQITGKQTSSEPMDSTYVKVTVDGIGADYGKRYEFKVLSSTGGTAHAVKEVLSVSC